MYLEDLRKRLVDYTNWRVRSGFLTERGLARISGLSQPHVHNVLKNVRTLSVEAADQILMALEITAIDLIVRFPFNESLGAHSIPVMLTRIGPGITPQFRNYCGYLPVPSGIAQDLVDPVLARVAPDLSLPEAILQGDTLLLDQNPGRRVSPNANSLYVVTHGLSANVRYARVLGNKLYITNSKEANVKNSIPSSDWSAVPLQGKDILELVRARIVWISREMGKTT